MTENFECRVYVAYDKAIDQSKFTDITEQYASASHNYLVGAIKFSDLVAADWANNPGNSVIFMN